jgi:hypothetical protein
MGLTGRGSPMYDLYAILGLTRSASRDEIRAAYRALAKRHHPDLNSGDRQSEWLIKGINRAFEILGNPESRAAYDREVEQERAAIRRRFWGSAAIGAATFIMTVISVWLTSMWTQTVSNHQSQKGEPKVLVGNENAVKKSPAEVVANSGPVASGDGDERDTPSELVIASVPGAFGEPLISAIEEKQGAPPSDRDAHSAPVVGPAAGQKISSASSPKPAQSPQHVIITSAPPNNASSRTGVAMTTPLEAGTKQPTPARVVTQPSHKSNPRNVMGKTAVLGRVPKKPSALQGVEREPRIVARTATALRWPSADEPFVNLGGRSR